MSSASQKEDILDNKGVIEMQEQQTSLFKLKPEENKSAPVLTIADKAYQNLQKHKLADRLNIYPHDMCISIILDIAQQPNHILGEDLETLCKQVNKTQPHCYYHFKDGQFIQYNGWLMNQICKEYAKHQNGEDNNDGVQMDSAK